MRYKLDLAEHIRNKKSMTPEEFSLSLGSSYNTYPVALKRGYITKRMVRDISLTHHVKMADFQPVDGT